MGLSLTFNSILSSSDKGRTQEKTRWTPCWRIFRIRHGKRFFVHLTFKGYINVINSPSSLYIPQPEVLHRGGKYLIAETKLTSDVRSILGPSFDVCIQCTPPPHLSVRFGIVFPFAYLGERIDLYVNSVPYFDLQVYDKHILTAQFGCELFWVDAVVAILQGEHPLIYVRYRPGEISAAEGFCVFAKSVDGGAWCYGLGGGVI